MMERKARVLVVDAQSDRRAASVMAHAKSDEVGEILVTSGGGLLSHNCLNLPESAVRVFPVHHADVRGVLRLAQETNPDLVEVGQEDAIYNGVTDTLRGHGFLTFGVSRTVGRYEWDKAYARREMGRYGAGECLPGFRVFRKPDLGLTYIRQRFEIEGYEGRLFIKAAYPALGKGVFEVCSTEDTLSAFSKLEVLPNRAGRVFLIEDGVGGPKAEEFSGYFLGDNFADFGYYQDNKRIFDNDQGPNTGGTGSVGRISLITPQVDVSVKRQMIDPLKESLRNHHKSYQGFLYVAGMYDPESGRVHNIEFNCRNGGSEAATNMPGIKNDYYALTRSIAEGSDKVNPIVVEHDGKIRVAVAGMAKGYPEDYRKVVGRKVDGLESVIRKGEVTVLGAAIDDDFTVFGGRIFWLVAEGENLARVIKTVYRNMDEIHILGDRRGEELLHFRRDIASKELRRQLISTEKTPLSQSGVISTVLSNFRL